MSNASDFIIEHGVLIQYVGGGGRVTIPDGVTQIKMGAFKGSQGAILEVVFPASMAEIPCDACSYLDTLKAVEIPQGVTSIGQNAFRRCKNLQEIVLPDSVCSIDYGAFTDCKKLKNVVLPQALETIEGCAFQGCESLTQFFSPIR